MSDAFYNWLRRKYGWGEETFLEIGEDDPEFAESLVKEYCSIAVSYGYVCE